jgi:D-lyxose ketol-isomerase
MLCRNGESDKVWFRSDRFFNINQQWYFATREQIDIGPFGTESAARQGLQLFIKNLKTKSLSDSAAAAVAVKGTWAQTLFH